MSGGDTRRGNGMGLELAKGVKIGTKDKYVLIEKIGEGASSEVFAN